MMVNGSGQVAAGATVYNRWLGRELLISMYQEQARSLRATPCALTLRGADPLSSTLYFARAVTRYFCHLAAH